VKTILPFILTVLLFLSCQEIQCPKKPENLISKQDMMQILADVYISNASRSGSNNKIIRRHGIDLDSLLKAKHQLDSLQFAESNTYYASNLKLYSEIITGVQEILEHKKKHIDSIVTLENIEIKKRKNLSLKGASK